SVEDAVKGTKPRATGADGHTHGLDVRNIRRQRQYDCPSAFHGADPLQPLAGRIAFTMGLEPSVPLVPLRQFGAADQDELGAVLGGEVFRESEPQPTQTT